MLTKNTVITELYQKYVADKAKRLAKRVGGSKIVKYLVAFFVATFSFTSLAHAGTTGAEFQDAYTMLTEWINGYFGRALAIAFLLVGLFMGIARQNLMACGVSIAVAFGLIITPTILDNVLSATVSEATVTIQAPAAVEAPLVLIGQPQ